MTTIAQGQHAYIFPEPGQVYRVQATGVATVQVIYGAPSAVITLDGNSQTFGPYDSPAKLRISANTATADYTLLRANYAELTAAQVAGGAVGVLASNNSGGVIEPDGDVPALGGSVASTSITDSTAAGRAILTAANAAAQRTSMGAMTSNLPAMQAAFDAGTTPEKSAFQASVSGGSAASGFVTRPEAVKNVVTKLRAALSGSIVRIPLWQFGDSVAGYVSDDLLANWYLQYGEAGKGPGSISYSSATGGAAPVLTRFDLSPNGIVYNMPAGSTTRIGSSGSAFSGTYFSVYVANEPGAGSITVELLDAAGAVQMTMAMGQSCSGAIGTVTKVSTTLGSAAPRYIKVTAIGTAVNLIGGALVDTSASGAVSVNFAQGGISMLDGVNATSLSNLTAVLTDANIAPALCTYSMRDDASTVAAKLPQLLAVMDAAAPKADWLFLGSSAGARDSGATAGSEPSYLENEAVRVIATARKDCFVDVWAFCGSYADLLARDPAYDGNHLGDAEKRMMTRLVFDQTGLANVYGVAATSALRAPSAISLKFTFSKTFSIPSSVPAGSIGTDNSNSSVIFTTKQWYQFLDSTESFTNLALILSPNGNRGAVFGPADTSMVSNAAFYPQNGGYGFYVHPTTGVVTLYAKVGGAMKSLILGTLI